MGWQRGHIELDCGTMLGIEDWDRTHVGLLVFCPKHRAQHEVVRMSRIRETAGSRDAKLGVNDGPGSGAGAADSGAGAR